MVRTRKQRQLNDSTGIFCFYTGDYTAFHPLQKCERTRSTLYHFLSSLCLCLFRPLPVKDEKRNLIYGGALRSKRTGANSTQSIPVMKYRSSMGENSRRPERTDHIQFWFLHPSRTLWMNFSTYNWATNTVSSLNATGKRVVNMKTSVWVIAWHIYSALLPTGHHSAQLTSHNPWLHMQNPISPYHHQQQTKPSQRQREMDRHDGSKQTYKSIWVIP